MSDLSATASFSARQAPDTMVSKERIAKVRVSRNLQQGMTVACPKCGLGARIVVKSIRRKATTTDYLYAYHRVNGQPKWCCLGRWEGLG